MSRDFNGSSQFAREVRVPAATPLTFSIWVYPDITSGSGKCLVGVYGGSLHWQFLGMSVALNRWYVSSRAGGSERYAASTTALAAGQWTHVAGVIASSTSRKIFVNGVEENTDTASAAPTINFRTGWAARLDGASPSASPSYFDGKLAESAIYTVALTAAEVASLAAGASPLIVRPGSLWSYVPFHGAVFPEPDLKGESALLAPVGSEAPAGSVDPRIYTP